MMQNLEKPQIRNILFLGVTILMAVIYFVWQSGNLGGQYWNYDEGVWSMEARLINQGNKLYSEIYTPAPPLFVLALAAGFNLLEENIETARLVSLLFASVGLVATALIGDKLYSKVAGITAMVLLAFAPDFFLFSRVPNGNQASLGVFMWAMLFGLYYRDTGKRYWLYLSSTFATIGIFLKFVPFYMIPVLAFLVASYHFTNKRNSFREQLKGFIIATVRASIPFVLMLLACLVIFDLDVFIDQAFLHHLSGRVKESGGPEFFFEPLNPASRFIVGTFLAYGALEWSANLLGNLTFFLINHQGLTLLSLLGVFRLWQFNKKNFVFIVVWLLATILMTVYHKPMFTHLFVVYLYPLVILAGISVARFLELIKNINFPLRPLRVLELGIYAVILAVSLYEIPALVDYIREKSTAPNDELLITAIDLVEATTNEDDWILTDIQYIAFAAGRNVPPPAAETSEMRFENDGITFDNIEQWTLEYSPKIVITARVFRDIPGYNEWLAQSYSIVFGDDLRRFYVYRRNE